VEISRILRDFQALWGGWKTCFRFSTRSMARHFHSSPQRWAWFSRHGSLRQPQPVAPEDLELV
jgi:antibiotic biosynthesis monooxygenase (ABM) superfamily enzyme